MATLRPLPEGFRHFGHLPLELRLKIWHYSFQPRVVELHGRRAHYADAFRHGGSTPGWQSASNNPAALAVNTEARAAALRYYRIQIPLALAVSCQRPGDTVTHRGRVLYLNPAVDTVAMLGDLDFYRLSSFLSDIRHRDPAGIGLKRLAVSARWTSHGGAGSSIRMIFKTIFPELAEFIVYLFDSSLPPEDWVNGTCLLEDCAGTSVYKAFEAGGGKHLREGDKWMVIGKSQLKIMQLAFFSGW
ncbi:hypothetical protein CCM_04965 [Cordyceps militaris CM01]|uniref:2EXR domain-containing protein n=1 Tax=Cordyceps militaris (strain CM01) TaxID=983644 RepID=G3JFL6_CORMM|nr:uncharacterized protein CCM_04965 [Cordyceps militaris CM01]EGX93590.1 hypothetical protein CCM_04965 [Cordyceps militaris CM01]